MAYNNTRPKPTERERFLEAYDHVSEEPGFMAGLSLPELVAWVRLICKYAPDSHPGDIELVERSVRECRVKAGT